MRRATSLVPATARTQAPSGLEATAETPVSPLPFIGGTGAAFSREEAVASTR